MSLRSEEFLEQARDRLVMAREVSEDDEHVPTHRGTWNRFRTRYVVTDAFDDDLCALAQQAQRAREQGDYEAVKPHPGEAERYLDGAASFIAAMETMLDSSP